MKAKKAIVVRRLFRVKFTRAVCSFHPYFGYTAHWRDRWSGQRQCFL